MLRPVYTGDFCRDNSFDAISVALKLQQVSSMFETPAISRQQIALKIAPGLLQVRSLARQKLHRVAATKIACVKGSLYFIIVFCLENTALCLRFALPSTLARHDQENGTSNRERL